MRSYSLTETAKLIREALKAAFPKTKFAVRSKSYSGGCSITARWTDGPTQKQVDVILKGFERCGFDGMQDLKTYNGPSEYAGQLCEFGADYVFGARDNSEAMLRKVAAWVAKETGEAIEIEPEYMSKGGYRVSAQVKDSRLVPFTTYTRDDGRVGIAHNSHRDENLAQLVYSAMHQTSEEEAAASPETPQLITEEYIDRTVSTMLGTPAPLEWKQAAVGCYWNAGEYRISSFASYRGGVQVKSGYRLAQKFEPMGEFDTLSGAMSGAEAIRQAEVL